MNYNPCPFSWNKNRQPSQFATDPKFASKQQGSAGMPAKDHPLRNLSDVLIHELKHKQKTRSL